MTALHQLVMRTGPNPGTNFSLEGDLVTIGRDSTNTIVINDAEVSRRHARLNAQGGKYYIEDMGSTNGTFVNGQRLTGPYVLKSGDVISFGEQISLLFESLSYDPNATMMSAGGSSKATMAAAPSPVVSAPRPISQPQPQPIQPEPEPQFAGQIPAGPAIAAAPESGGSNRKWLLIVIVLAVLFVICLCLAFFLWIDSDPSGQRWCMIAPFLSGCQ